ncbi:MAG: ATP-dependent protease LonB [Cellulosilyticaceae bacterium]
MVQGIVAGIQLFFTCVIGIYFLTQLQNTKSSKVNLHKDSVEKYEEMEKLRRISLSEPLTERMRPKKEKDIIGQVEGVRALKNALCTPNPQHIIIYGSPGVGKTAAARIALEVAKESPFAVFKPDAKFIELDATTLRFDERSVADPLIGSVHDPIYQGAGAYGSAGVPQPKPGAVTKAHGGVLFIDEIGELHPIQMNKLLKVLEDRKVFLESAYYSSKDENIPKHIHDIFQRGLPADFRLVGATTRSREELPPALRSRCVEIHFKDLEEEDLEQMITNTVENNQFAIEDKGKALIVSHAANGRDAITILQTAYNKMLLDGKEIIREEDVEWVVKSGGYTKQVHKKLDTAYHIGKVNGLGVVGHTKGMVLEVQAIAKKVEKGNGSIKITGIVEEEEIRGSQRTTKRKSMASSSVENVLTLLQVHYNIDISQYFIHINFPSGMPIDGPSAGLAMFCAVYSAITNEAIPSGLAITGEVTIHGEVYPVGGVPEKIMAAKNAGAKAVLIPKENMQASFEQLDIEIIPVSKVEEAIHYIWEKGLIQQATSTLHA